MKIGAVCGIERDHRGGVRFLRRTWIGPLEQNRSTRRDGCKTVPVATCAERSGDRLSPSFRIFVFSTFAPTIGPPRQTPHDRQMLSTSKQLTTPSARPSRRLAFFSEMVGSGRSLTPGSQTPRKFSPHVEAAVTELLPSKRPPAAEAAPENDVSHDSMAVTMASLLDEPTPVKSKQLLPSSGLQLQMAGTPTLNPDAPEFRLPPSPPKPTASTNLSIEAPEFVPLAAKSMASSALNVAAPEFVPPALAKTNSVVMSAGGASLTTFPAWYLRVTASCGGSHDIGQSVVT